MKPEIGKKYYLQSSNKGVIEGKCMAVIENTAIMKIDFEGVYSVHEKYILAEIPPKASFWKKFLNFGAKK